MENKQNQVKELLKELTKLIEEMSFYIQNMEKIPRNHTKKISEILSDLIFELLISNIEPQEIQPILDKLLKLSLNEENFESPLEAKSYLYPYLVLFYEELEQELDKLVEDCLLLIETDNSLPFKNLAERFFELQMIEPFKELISKGKVINEEIVVEVLSDIAVNFIVFLTNELNSESPIEDYISSLEYILREIVMSSKDNLHPSIIEKLSFILANTPSLIEKVLSQNLLKEENLKTICLLLSELALKYKDSLKEYFDSMDLKLPEKARPQFVIITAKLCNLLASMGYEENELLEKFKPIIEEYQYPIEEFKKLCKNAPKENGKVIFTLEPGKGVILTTPSIESLVEIAKDSVFPLIIQGKVGNKNFSILGTCFIYKQTRIEDGYKLYLLTNLHNIQGIHVILNQIYENYRKGDEVNLNIFVKIDGAYHKVPEVYVPVKEIYNQFLLGNPEFRKFDFAVFQLYSKTPRKFFGIRKNLKIKQGENIYAFGYPQGLALSMSEGIVSHVYDDFEDEEHYQLLGTIQHSILINPGNSGGPTVKENGELIGISTFGLRNSVGLNFSIDIRFISNFLKDRDFFRVFKVQNYINESIERLKIEKSLF